jgi:hypothetical protein
MHNPVPGARPVIALRGFEGLPGAATGHGGSFAKEMRIEAGSPSMSHATCQGLTYHLSLTTRCMTPNTHQARSHGSSMGAARSARACFAPPWFLLPACRLSVLGLQIFPSGAPKPAPRAELEACSDRTKSKEQRGGLALVVS